MGACISTEEGIQVTAKDKALHKQAEYELQQVIVLFSCATLTAFTDEETDGSAGQSQSVKYSAVLSYLYIGCSARCGRLGQIHNPEGSVYS